MIPNRARQDQLMHEIAELRQRMAEAEDILHAIRNHEVDALVVGSPDGERVLALETANDADRQMVEQMREGAATLSADGVVLFANQQLARLLDCPLDSLIARPIETCVPPDEWPRLAAMLAAPEGGRLNSSLRLGDGRRVPALFSASRLRLDEGPVTLLLVTDLTYERQADRVARLLHLATRLSVPLDVDEVAEAIVHGAIQAFNANAGFVAMPSEDGKSLRLLHAVGYSAQRARQIVELPLSANLPTTEAARNRQAVAAESLAERNERFPEWPAPTAAGESSAVLAVPLVLPERFVGVLQVSFGGPRPFDDDDRDFALTVAQQCAQALERASLYSEMELRVQGRTAELSAANRELGQANERLTLEIAERRSVQRQLERAREQERARVARELHDELGGSLTALKMAVSVVLNETQLPADAHQQLAEVVTMVDTTIEFDAPSGHRAAAASAGRPGAAAGDGVIFPRFHAPAGHQRQIYQRSAAARAGGRSGHRLFPHLSGIADQYHPACAGHESGGGAGAERRRRPTAHHGQRARHAIGGPGGDRPPGAGRDAGAGRHDWREAGIDQRAWKRHDGGPAAADRRGPLRRR